MLPFLLGALLAVPAASPSPPCQAAHRLFCGAIRLVPRDPQERRAFVGNAIGTLIDGIVTARNTRGNPALEGNPFVRPFVRGGFGELLLGWTGMEIGQRSIAHHFHLEDTRIESMALSEHLSGIASWLSPRTYGWIPNEWQAYHQPYIEGAWVRFDATGGRF
ncbi:MAG TPA: hypothetical protein VMD47_07205 [Candidatus Acidoferrales bacterium]|nr:hypothetical protein [Candidatus Acidoferrales bacterium]